VTAADLRDLFVNLLARQSGTSRRRWRIVVGDVRVYSRETHPHCNWAVYPSGTAPEVAVVERFADDLRMQYPIVSR
jgi:hypothetical protein